MYKTTHDIQKQLESECDKDFIKSLLNEPLHVKILAYFKVNLDPKIVDLICKYTELSTENTKENMNVLGYRVEGTKQRITSINYKTKSVIID